MLTTGTENTRVLYEPLAALGHELSIITYDAMTYEGHAEIPSLIDAIDPAWVLLVGAIEAHHGRPVVGVGILSEVGARWPLVHLCCDGAEPAWWPQLEQYYDHGRFALQVNIDGVRTGPIGERGVTALCPIDPDSYVPCPWSLRPIEIGFGGNAHIGARAQALGEVISRGLVTHRSRDGGNPAAYREFVSLCRAIWNHPMTGGTTSQHVKARVVEAAAAGALIIEAAGSPLEEWLIPGVDYRTYQTADDVAAIAAQMRRWPRDHEALALRTRAKLADRCGPTALWGHVIWRIGLGPERRYLQPTKFVPWAPGPRSAVDRAAGLGNPSAPILLQSYRQTNIVQYRDRIYLVPQAIGTVDLENQDHRARPEIRSFGTIDEARRAL